ncbi:CpaF family protein [Paenibacillus sp.]|uniref:CpaF family protein n=1 Tax=Paenibacillus sp. TaxID=58172 RepID=UPI002D2BF73F|nr:CpaF family protein [Paenibacillus sp.]HZG85512.1 CpaF family protein [Paenibacillus sp.]
MSLLERIQKQQGDGQPSTAPPPSAVELLKNELKAKLQTYLLQELRSDELNDPRTVRRKVKELSETFFSAETERLGAAEEQHLIEETVDEVTGYGPITIFIKDPEVSEIMVNGPNQIFVEKGGKLVRTRQAFRDDRHVLQVIEKIVAPLGRRIDESAPMVDARLPDGSRVNAVIPPLALNGPTLTIRKFPTKRLEIGDLVRYGTLSPNMAKFLEGCIVARLNLFISGGTGSGKTTLLNVLSSFIPSDERIITIEDAAELKLHQEHVVSLETRPPNVEGKGAVTIRDLVRNSLRMRPERIIIGEVRSAEALDMLQAMNTGHDGSLATGHANSPRDMLARLETMVLMSGMELPVRAIREQIAGAIDLIVQQTRMKDGSRKITHITEVLGMEGDTIVLQDIFVFRQTGAKPDGTIIGDFAPTGIRPQCLEKLDRYGIAIPPEWFWEG